MLCSRATTYRLLSALRVGSFSLTENSRCTSSFNQPKVSDSVFESFRELFPKPTQRLRIEVKKAKRNLKHEVTTSEGRLLRIGQILTRLFIEERIELPRYQADEVRQYAERLIQLSIEYGPRYEPLVDIANYYLKERDAVVKLFEELAPRFENYTTSYTAAYRHPKMQHKDLYNVNRNVPPQKIYVKEPRAGRRYDWSILELRGNPFPPVISHVPRHDETLLNALLNTARRNSRKTQE